MNDKKNGSKETPCGIHGHLKHKHRSPLETPQRMHEVPDQHMNWDSFVSYNIDDRNDQAVPMDIPFEDQKLGKHDSKQTTHARTTPPPTPPPPRVTSWDFLSLFSSMANDNYYDNMKYVCNASANNSDLDLREVERRLRHSNKETSSDEDTELKDDINYETFLPKKLARDQGLSSGTGDEQISLLRTESLGTVACPHRRLLVAERILGKRYKKSGRNSKLIRLWKFMATCHQKQLQVIMKAKSHVHISRPHIRKKSSSRATLRLEKTILNWIVCFSNLVNTQKAFVKYLNEWLQRCIPHQPEEADQDEVIASFSPSRIGAPLIFTLCNDWSQAIDKISESGVSRAIDNFSSSLHLYEMLDRNR
ncbi:hypothetical protein L6164_031812 [Bauhinia variegata]|uniref:Uncharacterized protein n=1 Tax=Bauhinia variegata TaxID=167791 RepID=A0ACB9KLT2_BAUVA|nr:hypothetical protein L6164_031812 [Bauhinia variegata]